MVGEVDEGELGAAGEEDAAERNHRVEKSATKTRNSAQIRDSGGR